jgi:hypothetical protein
MQRIGVWMSAAVLAAAAWPGPVVSAGLGGGAPAAAVPSGAVEVLNPESYWRWYATLRTPVIPAEALRAAGQPASGPKVLTGRVVPPPYNEVDHQDSAPPPSGWEAPTFDDFGWPRARLSWVRPTAFGRFSSAGLCLRGKFLVTDPAALRGLHLTIKYYGGVRVLLNGREVARQHLPAGDLAPDTPAEMYPNDVYVDDQGVIVPMGGYEYGWNSLSPAVRRDAEARVARRTRVLGPIRLPAEAVRQGENVLAVEVRRSEYPAVAPRWFTSPEGRTKPFWIPIHLFDLRLEADGAGVRPNVARPKGLQVWTENTNDRVTVIDYGDEGEGLRPMRIVGARNGSFCGQLVIGSDDAMKGVQVRVGELKPLQGTGVIPPEQVTVLYALPDISYRGSPTWFDGLQSEPPAAVAVNRAGGSGGAVQPVLVRVAVPKDAPAGAYRGQAVVSVAGAQPVNVPIELSLADWLVPDPKDFRTYVGVYQSPTSVALQYKVKEWSEEHWKLLDRSFALLGRAGNKLLNVTVVDRTQFGNDEGVVYWIRKPDGSFTYDFTVFDRLLDLALAHCKTLEFVALHVWHSGGWEVRKADQENTVTVIDEKTGARERMQVPVFGTEASQRFWKPLFEAVQARLAKRGLDKAMCLGILSDGTAPREVFQAMNEIVPGGARWMRGCHGGTYSPRPDPLPGGGVTVLHEFCYGFGLPDPAKPLPTYWQQRTWPGADYDRISNHEQVVSLAWYRDTAVTALMKRTRGIGRVCLDFWDVLPHRSGQQDLYNRWPQSSCAQREPSMKKMAWAAPDGAATTLRYEAFCEGIQYADAMIAVSEAVDRKAAALGKERTAAFRDILVEMLRREVKTLAGPPTPLRPNHEGWQDLTRRLFEAAAVAAKS